jgi:long-subunit fatty acid transport protein
MRKLSLVFIAIAISGTAMAGGIITNTNQSAMFTRLQTRDATLGIDATYFNPAGLTLLPNDGFYFSINNQTLGQTRTITSDYALLNESSYTGDVSAPLFPGIYAVYKTGKWAFSAGFNPIGGGGGGDFDKGLPSFEYMLADIPSLLSNTILEPVDQAIEGATGTNPGFSNISGYQIDINFKGTSIIFGYQLNASYKITDYLSVALGGRYVNGKDTYKGSLTNYQIIAPEAYGGTQTPGNYLRLVASQVPDAEIQGTLEATAAGLDAATADKEVDVELTAQGVTPIISVDIKPSEKFNVALKYEFNTKLEYTTEVKDEKDGGGLYVDGEKSRVDIPAQLVIGATYRPLEPLLISTGFHYYFDKQADWNGREEYLDANLYELALGLEYDISEKFAVSGGYLYTKSGASGDYQSDLSYSLPSSTIGGGFELRISPMLNVNLAGSYTMYQEGSGEKQHNFAGQAGYVTWKNETYDKDVWIVAIGININLGASSE